MVSNVFRRPVAYLIVAAVALLAGCGRGLPPEDVPTAGPAAVGTRLPEVTKIRSSDDAVMVRVPAGEFVMGSSAAEIQAALDACRNCPDDWFDAEMPQHKVTLPEYWIDKFEVTNRQFARFIDSGGYSKRELWTQPGWDWRTRENRDRPQYWDQPAWNQPDLPVVGAVWFEAVAYCRWAGGRLPSEAMWEKAAGWDPVRMRKVVYPWGDDWDSRRANTSEQGLRHTVPVGKDCERSASPYGACDMAGNAWEWCSTLHRSYPYNTGDGREELEIKGTRTLRGGSWINERHEARSAYRLPPFPGDFILFDPTNGFRCAVDAQ